MEIVHRKGFVYYLPFPMVDSLNPIRFKSGIAPIVEAWSRDGVGSWVSLSISGTPAEVGTSGVYEIAFLSAEMNHDQVLVKFSHAFAADSAYLFNMASSLVSPVNLEIRGMEILAI